MCVHIYREQPLFRRYFSYGVACAGGVGRGGSQLAVTCRLHRQRGDWQRLEVPEAGKGPHVIRLPTGILYTYNVYIYVEYIYTYSFI